MATYQYGKQASKYQYGVQLCTFDRELKNDLMGTLAKVGELGFKGVEFAQSLSVPAKELKKALDAAGLACCGWHTNWSFLMDDKIDGTINYFKTIGNENIITGCPDDLSLAEKAALFNSMALKLEPHGMQLGIHNHADELRFYTGMAQCPLTAFLDALDQSVYFQMDNGHVINGRGYGILSLLRRYRSRLKTVHLKPYSLELGANAPGNGYKTEIGLDDVPWMDFMYLCRTIGGTQWYIVEYEDDTKSAFGSVEKCLKTLLAMEARGEI